MPQVQSGLRNLDSARGMMNLSRSDLLLLRKSALRRGVWFRALSLIERGVINLTISCVKKANNGILVRLLLRIVNQLKAAIRSGFFFRLELTGRRIAEERSKIGVRWGNKEASKWAVDPGYWRFLGLNSFDPSWRMRS